MDDKNTVIPIEPDNQEDEENTEPTDRTKSTKSLTRRNKSLDDDDGKSRTSLRSARSKNKSRGSRLGIQSDESIAKLNRRKRTKSQKEPSCWSKFKEALDYIWSVAKFLMEHPTWRMRKRQATVLTACFCLFANILPIFMANTKESVYTKIYNLGSGEQGLEATMFVLDISLLLAGYSGTAWHALPWLICAPFYWLHKLYMLVLFIMKPPKSIYQTFRLYDVLARAIVFPYLYLVVYSTFSYLVTKLKMGIVYDPQEEHVPIITPEVIEQMEDIASKQGMSAPEALLFIYKRTGKNWGVTATALKFDPNAKLPVYRGK